MTPAFHVRRDVNDVVFPDSVFDQANTPPVITGYTVGRQLGRGATSTVWAGIPDGGGEPVALKVISPDPDTQHELAFLRSIRHPGVVRMVDAVLLPDGRTVVVTDLVPGGSLADLVAVRGHLTDIEVGGVMRAIAETLTDVHQLGVIHADLTPGNILISREGRPVLADFGTARISGTRTTAEFGTPGFMDPVVMMGEIPTAASDVYGLGAVGWFALTGRPPPVPFQRPPLTQLVPSADRRIIQMIQAALASSPAERPTTMDLVAALTFAQRQGARVIAPANGCELTYRLRAAAREADGVYQPRHRRNLRRYRFPVPRFVGKGHCFHGRPGVITVSALIVAVLSLGWHQMVGFGMPHSAKTHHETSSTGASSPEDPVTQSLIAVAANRAYALSNPTEGVRAQGSSWGADDLRQLAKLGLHYRGVRFVPRDVVTVSASSSQVVVIVRWETSSYDVMEGSSVRRKVPADNGVPVRMTVQRRAHQWQVASVMSVAPEPSATQPSDESDSQALDHISEQRQGDNLTETLPKEPPLLSPRG
ncbi:MAG: serine/threonine-protein kinase [Actinomycetota bacterium]